VFGDVKTRACAAGVGAASSDPERPHENAGPNPALADHQDNHAGKPFFLYLAYNAPHWPLHARESDIAKYAGKYMAGWDALRKHKHWTHEGGIATPLIVHWPRGLKAKPGSITRQVGHVIDVMPTLCEIGAVEYPRQDNGKPVTPTPGKSLVPIFQGEQRDPHDLLVWEHFGNTAVRMGHRKLVRSRKEPWELYDMQTDRTELHNLAAQMPQKAKQLVDIDNARASKSDMPIVE